MLDTATTSSMTNSMKVLGAFVGADRMDEDEHPGEAVEQIEDDEAQPPALRGRCVVGGSARNCRHLVTMTAWITSTDAVQAPAVDRAGPQARQEADGADQQQDHQRGRQPVLRELAQQLVVEGGAGAGGRGQPVAGLADVLCGEPPAHRRAFGRARRDRIVRWESSLQTRLRQTLEVELAAKLAQNP